MKKLPVIVLATLLVTNGASPASREQQEMQRDIAQLQDQVRGLQSSFDQKMAALQTLVQQAVDAGNKANTNVSVLGASVTQTLEREMGNRLAPVAGLSSKVENLNNDMAEVKNSLSDVTTQLNRLRQQLTDINNAIKVIQAPPPPPPGVDTAQQGKNPPPPPAGALFTSAMGDYSSGKSEMAVSEFSDFVKFYPDDPNAPTAQLFIGQVHMGQQKYDQAVLDFDTVLERFPESKETPDAWFMKGMALKAGSHRDDAAKEFRALIAKYKTSDQAKQAREQLKAMGLSVATPAPASRKK